MDNVRDEDKKCVKIISVFSIGFSPLLLLLFLISFQYGEAYRMGVNYGQLGNNLPEPKEVVPMLKKMKIGSVKTYDINPKILQALANTNIKVSVMVPNEQIINVSASQSVANKWIKTNVVAYYPHTRINIVLVGNEILSNYAINETWYQLVPAMKNIRKALLRYKLGHIKVGTPHAIDVVNVIFPPSSASFRKDIAESIVKPMLYFLNRTKSYFFLDAYTFFPWSSNPKRYSLDYALLCPNHNNYTDPSGLIYTNLLDQQLDAVVFAMMKFGYKDISLYLTETGWPTKGDLSQRGASIFNAAHYNRRLAKKMLANPPLGTPLRPGRFIPTNIFALFNENQKGGPGTERNWGLLYPNLTQVYEVDLTGKLPESAYKALPPPPPPYKGKLWCVVDSMKANITLVKAALNDACSNGKSACLAIQKGMPCFRPNTIFNHASVAFNNYWQQFKKSGGSCYFQGVGKLVTKDPSYGSCKFPYIA